MRNDPYTLLTVAACLDHFTRRLARVPVDRAAEILDKLGHGEERFWWVYKSEKKFAWNANKVSELGLSRWPAKSICSIKFIGGPQGHRRLHKGTLLTLLVDRILLKVQESGLAGLDGIVDVDEIYA